MRKLLFGAVVALVAVLAVAGVASAVDATQAIDVKITNNKAGTKDKPKSIGILNVVTTTTPGAGSPAGTFATNKATIFFDKNLVFNAKAFKECKPSNKSAPVGSDVKSKCAGARIGGGKAAAKATVGDQENLTVTAYNGSAQSNAANRWFYLHVQGSTPLKSSTRSSRPPSRRRPATTATSSRCRSPRTSSSRSPASPRRC